MHCALRCGRYFGLFLAHTLCFGLVLLLSKLKYKWYGLSADDEYVREGGGAGPSG